VSEPTKRLNVPIIRNGDLYKPFSVICYTRQLTAIENKDYIGRYSLEQSRIYFESGEKVKNCTVEIINDSIFEAEETFQLKLTDIRGPENAKFTQNIMATVTITNLEDSSIISLLKKTFNTEEPSGYDATVIKTITIVRTGDLSRTSIVRVSTSDKTATAGLDYKPKTELLTFNPGVSALDFEVEILYDDEKEPVEMFSVNLGPKDPISGYFGKITTANVFIFDNNASDSNLLKNKTSDTLSVFNFDKQRKDIPFIKSMYSFLSNETDKDNYEFYAVSDEPLICFHVNLFLVSKIYVFFISF
jgi:extracelluar matrix protein FRAS1